MKRSDIAIILTIIILPFFAMLPLIHLEAKEMIKESKVHKEIYRFDIINFKKFNKIPIVQFWVPDILADLENE